MYMYCCFIGNDVWRFIKGQNMISCDHFFCCCNYTSLEPLSMLCAANRGKLFWMLDGRIWFTGPNYISSIQTERQLALRQNI